MSTETAGPADFISHFDDLPFHKMLGLSLLNSAPNYGKIMLTRTPDTPAGIGGSVHGGVLACMVDIAMLVAIFAELKDQEMPAGTADLSITYLRQAQTEHIYATARVIKRGRQLATIEVDITDDADKLCARGRTLYAFRATSDAKS